MIQRSLIPIAAFLSVLGASRPELTVSSTALTPRLHMVSADEEAHWRLWGSYRQSFGKWVSLQSHFEYGSENYILQNPFRIHDLSASVTLRHHSLRVGRMTLWNRLIQARIDGGEYVLKTEKLGSIKIVGGVPSVTDFSDTEFAEESFFFVSWGTGKRARNLEISSWGENDSNGTSLYAGTTFHGNIFSNIRIAASLGWDVTDSKLYYGRLHLSRRLENHLVRLGVRNKRYAISHPYRWVDSNIAIPPTVTFGITSSVAQGTSWWNQLVYRMGNPSLQYFRSTLFYGDYHVTLLGGIQGDRTLLGGGVGAARTLSQAMKLGGNILVNAVGYRDLAELRSGTSLYGWISFTPLSTVTMKLYGRLSRNPYYDIDGRGGLTIRAAF